MEPSFLQRYLSAFHRIEGWFQFDAALLFMAFSALQKARGVAGHTLEIGVHHGLSSIAIAALRGAGKSFVGIDLFEELRHQNISNSGAGDRRCFEENIREFYRNSDFVRTIARSSGDITAQELGTGFTFCHIDGGHSPEETVHDLRLCHDISSDGGLIALDDYFNPEHPGVCEGAVEFLLGHPGSLRPLAIAYNKVLFHKGQAPVDLDSEFLALFPGIPHRVVQFWKTPTLLLGAPLREFVDLYASTPERLVPLGAAGVRAVFTSAKAAIEAHPGAQVRCEIDVQNASGEPFPSGEGVFGLSYHLLDDAGSTLRHDNARAWLRHALSPGGRQSQEVVVTAPAAAGRYQIEIDLVWEGVMWFKDAGNPALRIPLTVR